MLSMEIGKKLKIFDGGMGSEIEKSGVEFTYPEELNITHPNLIKSIHKSYAEAGADIITTNTFGLNRVKYKGKYSISELCESAIENARASERAVFFDIGPTGSMLKPIGILSFDEAYEAFAEVVRLSCDKVDGYILETFSDLYELKAAMLAVKENTDKPVFATMTFDKTARTLTGTSPEVMVELLEGLGADALGVNCSLGPKELKEVVGRVLACAHIPIIIQPNRGLPKLLNGRTVYDLSVEEFTEAVEGFIEIGVSVVGGCCGTTPEFIKALSVFKDREVEMPENPYETAVTSYSRRVAVTDVTVCGERLNPTGKKRIKEAILNSDYDLLISEGIKQQEAGADLLDLNVGVPMIDEPSVMRAVCEKLQEYIDLPLQIDSSNHSAIEQGVRYYNGIPLINSVNGEKRVMDAVFPIAKKYGAVVLGLTLDENGIPRTAEERFEIAKRIVFEAEKYGIARHKIMIDTLVLTASSEQALVAETIKALSLVRTLGVKTALGVSNVSFGLPNRPLLNRTFLSISMHAGLTMPILNPMDSEMMGAVRAYKVLFGIDINSEQYIEAYKDFQALASVQTAVAKSNEVSSVKTLYDAVKRGLKNEIIALTEAELASTAPLDVVNDVLIKALNDVGEEYSSGKIFLPQLIASAESAKIAFEIVTERMPARTAQKEKIVLATVKGDVHDIGKNIVKTVLYSYGYQVIDLGKDVSAEAVVDACREHQPFAVGLSALMTTTVSSMEATVKALKEAGVKSKIFVGGAVLTQELADAIGADFYTEDALELVRTVEGLER